MKKKSLVVEDASPCMKCGSVQCAFCSDDIKQAVNGLCNEIETIISQEHEPIMANLVKTWFPSLY